MIEALELTKTFGTLKAVRGVSFAIERGEAVGFLGPNGAGKTTTFRMMAGSLSPDSGQVRLFGSDLFAAPIEAKRKLGYMPENAAMYPEMTVREYLLYRADLKGIAPRQCKKSVEAAAEKAGAKDMLGVVIGHLSKGYRQRVALSDALLGNPPALLLDEPTAGLDPNQVLTIRELIKNLRQEHAVILSTHVLSEVEATCDRALVIHRGKIVAQGTLAELDARRSGARAELRLLGTDQDLHEALSDLPQAGWLMERTEAPAASADGAPQAANVDEVAAQELPRYRLEFPYESETQVAEIVKKCVAANLSVVSAGRIKAPLDEVFAQLTQEKPATEEKAATQARTLAREKAQAQAQEKTR